MSPAVRAAARILAAVVVSVAVAGGASSVALSASTGTGLGLRFASTPDPAPLTTEAIWSFDPLERNPHRARWAVRRQVELVGLRAKPVRSPDGPALFAIEADGLVAAAAWRVRPAGAAFQDPSTFPCTSAPSATFTTLSGAQATAERAGAAWGDALTAAKGALEFRLARVRAAEPEAAKARARAIFDAWADEVHRDWRETRVEALRRQEWTRYFEQARLRGRCAGGRTYAAPLAQSLLEPLPAMAPAPSPTPARDAIDWIARAPARRWEGRYSVRLSLGVGLQRLVGQFLVDTGSSASWVSRRFLRAQGVTPEWLEQAALPAVRLPRASSLFHLLEPDLQRVAVPLVFDGIELSGARLAVPPNLLSLDSLELFAPPRTLAVCCDGVLGNDILRRYVVELSPGPPAEVILRDPRVFLPPAPAAFAWAEVATPPSGEPVSADCGAGAARGIRWDTASPGGFEPHHPFRGAVEAQAPRCPGFTLARPGFAREPGARGWDRLAPSARGGEAGSLGSRVPGVNVGMAALGRGRVIFDLPHGRIWLERAGLDRPLPSLPRADFALRFVLDSAADRRLTAVGAVGRGARWKVEPALVAGAEILALSPAPDAPGNVEEWDQDRVDAWIGRALRAPGGAEIRWRRPSPPPPPATGRKEAGTVKKPEITSRLTVW